MSAENPYLEKLDGHLSNIKEAAEAERDPHRSEILWNYLHHGAAELSGQWEIIFTPDMTIEEPHYEMRTGPGDPVVLDGQDAVKEFYAMIEDENMMIIDDGAHYLFVNDDALAEFGTSVAFVTGQAVLEADLDSWVYQDVEIEDPEATYVQRSRHAMYWPYTDDAKLVGEMVYQISPFEVFEIDPDEVPSLDQVGSVAESYLPWNVEGQTPYRSIEA